MKTVKYVPDVCKGEKPTFSGDIEVRLPTFDEKYQFLEDCGVEVNADKEVTYKNGGSIGTIRVMVRLSEKHYVAVSLKRLSDGEEYKSFQDMSVEQDCYPILIDVATSLLNGFKLGN